LDSAGVTAGLAGAVSAGFAGAGSGTGRDGSTAFGAAGAGVVCGGCAVEGVLGAAAGAFFPDGEGAGTGAFEGSGCAGAGAGCGAGDCWACAGGACAGSFSLFEQPLKRREKKSSAMQPRVRIFISPLYSDIPVHAQDKSPKSCHASESKGNTWEARKKHGGCDRDYSTAYERRASKQARELRGLSLQARSKASWALRRSRMFL
jgi:hypothetical protein